MGSTLSKKDQLRLGRPQVIFAGFLCAVFTAACTQSRAVLAAVFGGMAVVTLVVPPLICASEGWFGEVLTAVAAFAAISCVWLTLPISWLQWFACTAVLASWIVCLVGLTSLLNRAGMAAPVSAMIVVVVALAWLSWPVWLSPYLAGRDAWVSALAFAHPLLTLNGVLIDQGIWTERPQMYGWTALNQDVSYSLPPSVFWCVVLHAGAGLLAIAPIGMTRLLERRNAEHESTPIGTKIHE